MNITGAGIWARYRVRAVWERRSPHTGFGPASRAPTGCRARGKWGRRTTEHRSFRFADPARRAACASRFGLVRRIADPGTPDGRRAGRFPRARNARCQRRIRPRVRGPRPGLGPLRWRALGNGVRSDEPSRPARTGAGPVEPLTSTRVGPARTAVRLPPVNSPPPFRGRCTAQSSWAAILGWFATRGGPTRRRRRWVPSFYELDTAIWIPRIPRRIVGCRGTDGPAVRVGRSTPHADRTWSPDRR